MIHYLDTSVIVSLVAEEASAKMIRQWLDGEVGEIIVSDFARGEFVSALGVKARAGLFDHTGFDRHRLAGRDWMASLTSVFASTRDIAEATDHLLRFELALRLPGALHIAIAARCAATLVTLDRRQLRAAVALGINAVDPSATPVQTDELKQRS